MCIRDSYVVDASKESAQLKLIASYAAKGRGSMREFLDLGEGLVGQCAIEKQTISLTKVPEDYIKISSGLGETLPRNILVLPVIFEGQVRGVLELASLEGCLLYTSRCV